MVAERYRQKTTLENSSDLKKKKRDEDLHPTNVQQILDIVNRQRAMVLYFSIASGYLYAWLIAPTKGILKFHATPLQEDIPGPSELVDAKFNSGRLERLVLSVRDSLGEELSPCSTITEDQYNDDAMSDRPGFLRMVNRSHLLNSSK